MRFRFPLCWDFLPNFLNLLTWSFRCTKGTVVTHLKGLDRLSILQPPVGGFGLGARLTLPQQRFINGFLHILRLLHQMRGSWDPSINTRHTARYQHLTNAAYKNEFSTAPWIPDTLRAGYWLAHSKPAKQFMSQLMYKSSY